jgi:multiple sugar transport system permease protein
MKAFGRGSPFAGALRWAFLGLFAVWSLFPIYWIISMSLKRPVDTLAVPPKFFFVPVFDAYVEAFSQAPLLVLFWNSMVVALGATAMGIAVGVLGGYALARFGLGRRQKDYEFWVLSTRMAPPVAVALPFFIIYQRFGLQDTLIGLILVHVVFVLGIVTWILLETFRGLPGELEEAALVDGCGRWSAFFRVMLPLAAPGIAGAAVISFLLSWNEFFFALILTNLNAKTAPVGLYNFIGFQAIELNQLAAASSALLLPALIIVAFFQRYLISGLTMGAVKG